MRVSILRPFFINLWKIPAFVTQVLREHFVQVQNSLSLSCSDGPMRTPLRFDTMIEHGNVTAGAGAAAYPVYEVSNDGRAGMGGIYEGRWDRRVVLQLHNTRLRVLPGGIAVTDNDFSLPD